MGEAQAIFGVRSHYSFLHCHRHQHANPSLCFFPSLFSCFSEATAQLLTQLGTAVDHGPLLTWLGPEPVALANGADVSM